jgi:hypothetical protein
MSLVRITCIQSTISLNPMNSETLELVPVQTEPIRVWGKSTPTGHGVIVEIPPQKRNVYFPHSWRPVFLQFPYLYCGMRYNPTYFRCCGMAAYYRPTRVTAESQGFYYLQAVSGGICAGSSLMYHKHHPNLMQMIQGTLAAFWQSTFYSIDRYLLERWQKVDHPDNLLKIRDLIYPNYSFNEMSQWVVNNYSPYAGGFDLEKDLVDNEMSQRVVNNHNPYAVGFNL